MALLTYANSEKRYGLMLQAAFGTAAGAASACVELSCEATVIDKDIKFREGDESHGSRWPIGTSVVVDRKRSAPKVSIKGVVKKEEIDLLLYMYFQNVVEDEIADIFGKTFTHGTTQPDFTSDAGFVMSFCERSPVASQSSLIKDCICSSLKFSQVPGEPMMYEAELIGRGAITEDFDPSGSWAIATNDWFYMSDIDRYRYKIASWADATVPPDAGWDLALTQEVTLVGADGSGDFETFALTKRGGTFNMAVLENGTDRHAFKQASRNSVQLDWNVGFGHATPGTEDGDFDFELSGKIINGGDFDNAEVLGATAEVKLLGDNASTVPITLVIANGIDRTW